jgi:prephenate dehydrogenase
VAAATAALPVVGAAALVTLLRREEGWPDRAQAVGGELATLAVLLAGVEPAWADLAAANRAELLRWLALYSAELERWRALLAAGDDAALRAAVTAAADTAGEWTRGPRESEPARSPAIDWRGLLLGRFTHLFDKRA